MKNYNKPITKISTYNLMIETNNLGVKPYAQKLKIKN